MRILKLFFFFCFSLLKILPFEDLLSPLESDLVSFPLWVKKALDVGEISLSPQPKRINNFQLSSLFMPRLTLFFSCGGSTRTVLVQVRAWL